MQLREPHRLALSVGSIVEEPPDFSNAADNDMGTDGMISVALDSGETIRGLGSADILVLGQEGTHGRTPFLFVDARGKDIVEYHIDMHPAQDTIPGRSSIRALTVALPAGTCTVHGERTCKCHLPLQALGQDESIFKSCAQSKAVWSVHGKMPLRSKSQGAGEMVSAFQDRKHGFGFPMTEEQLQLVRDKHGAELAALEVKLEASPGCVFFVYGKNKQGYWTFEDFAKQCSVLMLCYETLYPNHQLLVEVDHSAGHGKGKEGALNVNNMNGGFGGKQGRLRVGEGSEMKEEEGYLGEHPLEVVFPDKANIPEAWQRLQNPEHEDVLPVERRKAGEVMLTFNNLKLKVGDQQFFQFAATDPPPFYDPLAHPEDSTETVKGKEVKTEGYVGKPKGMKQILWERGMHEVGMKVPDMKLRLAACKDFAGEETALQKLFFDRGHLLIFTPKCHPEIAGCGIEYSWGYQKTIFRRDNDCVAKHLHANIVAAQAPANMTIERVRKFERKARDYRHAYKLPGTEAHWAVEKLRKVCKNHRCTMDQDSAFIRDS